MTTRNAAGLVPAATSTDQLVDLLSGQHDALSAILLDTIETCRVETGWRILEARARLTQLREQTKATAQLLNAQLDTAARLDALAADLARKLMTEPLEDAA